MAPIMISEMMQGAKALSKRLIFSYVLDWVVLIIFGLITVGFTYITPNYRAFSLIDLNYSFPLGLETVSDAVLIIVTILVPAVIVVGVVFFVVPGPAGWRRMSKGEILRIKLWEFNVGLLGLALAQISQVMLVQGIKGLVGKPRPYMLAVCKPNVGAVGHFTVGGYGQDISPRWAMVNHNICHPNNISDLQDAFKSFPSGHNSTSWAGMIYLSLWLATKFGIAFPMLPYHKRDFAASNAERKAELPIQDASNPNSNKTMHRDYRQFGYRDEAAAAPTWTLFFLYVPWGVATFISASRYFDYYHDAWDCLGGTLIGLLTGYIGFRWYHGPVGRSAGWAWSPRSRDRAFAIGVGSVGYVTEQRFSHEPRRQDLELGSVGSQPLQQNWQSTQYEAVRPSASEPRNGNTYNM